MTQKTELQKIASAYNGILWQLKGNMGAIKVIPHRLPTLGLLVLKKDATPPHETMNKLVTALSNVVINLEYCEYLIKQLSRDHRDSYRYTMSLIKEEKEVH